MVYPASAIVVADHDRGVGNRFGRADAIRVIQSTYLQICMLIARLIFTRIVCKIVVKMSTSAELRKMPMMSGKPQQC